ncbi:carbohydrate sulfotransferase 15-like [Haliotis rufescens]|uniref:carbohydrate sulfotransferase 15-like n=1 Tax=Haliotis rufescens TaxID=6454 RepID=UPI00201F9416|nr:carbohydrate sulfotransferase 15-like [Haliotis rufescens]
MFSCQLGRYFQVIFLTIVAVVVLSIVSILYVINVMSLGETVRPTRIASQFAGLKSLKSKKSQHRDSCERCLRPVARDGVEDLFCMDRPAFLKQLKNPCWFEDEKLRCLPYFHILGCAKCATTDLSRRITLHPDIVNPDAPFDKEALWWTWRKYGYVGFSRTQIHKFRQYLNTFDPLARKLQTSMRRKEQNFSHFITMDGSPPDFWDFRGWPLLPQNHGRSEPCIYTPQLMKHIYADPKFILILRNPTDRLYSDYFFLRQGDTPEDFHEDVQKSLQILANCQKKHSQRQCYFSADVYKRLTTRIHFGCYSLFLKEWLKAFPLRHFLVLKTEEYSKNITNHMKMVYSFLDLSQVSMDLYEDIEDLKRSRVTKKKKNAAPMLDSTRGILDQFYAPCNQELADLLGDKKFLWQ